MNLSAFDRPIAYHRSLVPLAGVSGAVFLSQAIYWHNRSKHEGQWFYKTATDWEEETGMTRKEQEGARKKLVAAGVLKQERRGVPAKLWFQVQENALLKWLDEQTRLTQKAKPDSTNCQNKTDQKVPTITETTTETTQKDSAPTERQQAAPPISKQKKTTNHPYRFFEIINEHRSEPMAATAKELGQCKNLVKYANKDEDTLRRKIQLYQADPFWGKKPITAATLSAAWNGLEGKAPGEKSGWAAEFDKKMNGGT